ncbi:cytochrome P450 [Hypoxylon trugodes]|uniref:cytochrome P450 n=1 Tax=Hypoxylon trugodes TaxID=326681 RepID=UPI00219B3EB9|nr:cytochrome P450 [Hypoxylon trugodes]KAI1387264.1 cytochrome P450 [Hypoxylon trugodes]
MRKNPNATFIRYLSFANTEVLVPISVEAFKEILQTKCYSFQKSAAWRRIMKEILGDGIVSMEFDRHRAHRKILNSCFTVTNIRKLEPVFKAKAFEVNQLFDRSIAVGNDGETGVIDCCEYFSKFTLDVTTIAVLGTDAGSVASTTLPGETKPHDIEAKYELHDAYMNTLAQGTLGGILMLANSYVPTRWLPLQANRDFLFGASWLRNYVTQLLRKRHEELKKSMDAGKYETSGSRDILTFLLEESMPGGSAEGATESETVGHLLNCMAGGHETSAYMLSFGLYFMANKPDIQNRLREEILELGDDPSFSELDRLSYLDNFIKETLRLYPPATGMFRETIEDITIQGVPIPKGTLFDIMASVPALNPAIWGGNADEVDPTRWDRLSGEQLSPYVFQCFSSGPRICPGRSFAFMEIKIILAEIIRNFRILEVAKGFKIQNPSLTMRPSGLEIRLERITP